VNNFVTLLDISRYLRSKCEIQDMRLIRRNLKIKIKIKLSLLSYIYMLNVYIKIFSP